MLKKLILLLVVAFYSVSSFSQENYGSDFKIIKELKSTKVKDQAHSGTCWAFATVSFLESELLRMGQGEFDLSEMYIVNKIYHEKAKLYLELHGKSNFSSGGQAHDVIYAMGKYGLVTEEAYPGIEYEEEQHDHSELDAVLYAMVKSFNEKKNGYLTSTSLKAIDAVLDTYLGKVPGTFSTHGKDYTPKLFVKDMGLDPTDYVELTSYTEYPYYEQFILRVPDNWSANSYYNLPLDELMDVMDNAIKNGFTVCWDGDVSGGFSRSRGVAKLDDDIKPTETVREKLFRQQITTDDHLMHITGIAKGKYGGKYYLTKNSWGTESHYGGYWFMSEDFVKINTIAILVHKDAIPASLASKLGIK